MCNIGKLLTIKSLANSTTARTDIELLISFALDKPRGFLYAHPEYGLTPEQEKKFSALLKRRENGEPIAYILGKKEFWSLTLMVNENVLIPRPETELLVEVTLNRLGCCNNAIIADLGTGSGAIALALASERPKWNIVATDINKNALEIASYNASKLNINNVEFFHGAWCAALPNKKFDLIISNPPYIAQNDPHLQDGDVRFEPKIALEAGDGLSALKKIIAQAINTLKPGGLLLLEHGYDQREKVRDLLYKNNYKNIMSYKDLFGIYRIIAAEK